VRGRLPVLVGALMAVVFVAACVAALSTRNPAVAAFQPPADGTAGPTAVTLSRDSAASDQGENVRSLLQRHFDAINTRNYGGWSETVVSDRKDAIPADVWAKDYATTQDGSIRVERIDGGPPGADGRTTMLVMVRFVSTQDPSSAPEDARVPRLCWHSMLPLTGSPWRIGSTGQGASAYEAC
jgi:hypothetical protein